MKKLLLGLMLLAVPAFGQQSTCVDTTLSATGRTLISVPGGAFQYAAANFTYRTTGSPTGVSISIDAGNTAVATQTPFEQIAAVTNTTGADMGKANGPYRNWYANLGTLSGGSSPTVILTSCFFRGTLISLTGPTGVITGSGTTGTLPKFSGANALADSVLTESAGNLSTTGTFTSTGLNINGATSGAATLAVTATGGELLLNSAGGNVGIGTSDPSEKLYVNGGIRVANDQVSGFESTTPGLNAARFYANTDNDIVFETLSSADNMLLQTTGGKVGINDATPTEADLTVDGDINGALYETRTNCADSAGDAACTAAPAGSIVIDAADTDTVVSTTAVTADSQIFIQEDSSLNTRLSVTCNTTIARVYTVTARTAGTSFTVTASAAPVTNPACLSFLVFN